MELTPFEEMTLVSDSKITSDMELAIAANFMSKLAVDPVRLSELQFCIVTLTMAGGGLASPALT